MRPKLILLTPALAALVILASHTPAGAPAGASCSGELGRVSAVLRGTKALTARFVHTLDAPGLNQHEREEGTLSLARGGRMRWDYSLPKGKLAWADGKRSYLYLPDDRQVLIQPLDGSLPVRILTGGDLTRECRCLGIQESGAEHILSLEVVDPEAGIRELTVRVEKARGVITSLSYKDPLGNRIGFSFTAIQLDADVPESTFRIAIPKGARVVENP